jgi:hypothetical protein
MLLCTVAQHTASGWGRPPAAAAPPALPPPLPALAPPIPAAAAPVAGEEPLPSDLRSSTAQHSTLQHSTARMVVQIELNTVVRRGKGEGGAEQNAHGQRAHVPWGALYPCVAPAGLPRTRCRT